jgi:type 1 glutamine amidotransferase
MILVSVAFLMSAALVSCKQRDTRSTTEAKAPRRILVFSKTAGFRHESIPAGIQAIQRIGAQRNLSVDVSEDASLLTSSNLKRWKVVVFLSTTGDVLGDPEQRAFEGYIRQGGGYVGVHSATDTEYDWPWYGDLVGAYFSDHPAIQPANIRVINRSHQSTSMLPVDWKRTDEWYNFRSVPRDVEVLAMLDETSYSGGHNGAQHPIAWFHTFEGGRSWYTGGGHTVESFSEPLFVDHLAGGILWAGGLTRDQVEPSGPRR